MSINVVVSRSIPLSEATEKEKIKFAKKNRRKVVLEELARTGSDKVKLALFQNPCLSYDTVANILENDINNEIQWAVKKYWDKKIDCNLIFMHLIKAFFAEFPDFSDNKTQKAITAYLYLLQKKYDFNYQDEEGHCIYFYIQSPTSHIVSSKMLEDKFEVFEYLYKNKYKLFEDKIKYQDRVYQKVIKIKQWFEETKRPEEMDDFEWIIILGKYAIAKQNNMLMKYSSDENYHYAINALNELYSC